jgi:hypothetical protein
MLAMFSKTWVPSSRHLHCAIGTEVVILMGLHSTLPGLLGFARNGAGVFCGHADSVRVWIGAHL